MAVVVTKVKDKATGQLSSGISAATLSIPLKSGEGALFPQPYTGTASSAGSATVLNDTGDLGGLAVGDFVRNVTDGSWAFVVTAGTNSVTTTRLKGGTDNTWDSGDTWRANEFIVTVAAVNGSGVDTAYEEVLISNRSTDTLTVPTGGRGYNSTTAQSFSADDYVQLRVAAPQLEEIKSLLKELNQTVDTNTTTGSTNTTDIATLQTETRTGSYLYAAAAGSANAFTVSSPALAAYAAGNVIRFKANHTISGSATVNVNSLGAKTIKKLDGATNLSSGDIQNNQLVVCVYDGTNFQMVSPVGQSAAGLVNLGTVTTASADVGASSTAENTVSPTWTGSSTVTANSLAAGSVIRIRLGGNLRLDSGTCAVRVKLGGTTMIYFVLQMDGGTTWATNVRPWWVEVEIDARSVGATGSLIANGLACVANGAAGIAQPWTGSADGVNTPPVAATLDTTAGLAVAVTAQFSASDADHAISVQNGSIKVFNAP